MTYFDKIAADPSLLLGPVVIGGIISAVVSIFVGWRNRKAASAELVKKIDAERANVNAKLAADADKIISDRVWADYSLRRDIYLDLAKQIGFLFIEPDAIGNGTKTVAGMMTIEDYKLARKDLNETTRKLRIIGTDEVVNALNALTNGVKTRAHESVTTPLYGRLMNVIRKDIRNLELKVGAITLLNDDAFPIES